MNLRIKPLESFKKEVKKLSKKYKHIANDLKVLNDELTINPKSGVELGNNCYKIRLSNSSIPTEKSGGFIVIYYFIDTQGIIYLITIYSKNEIINISDTELLEILKNNGIF